MLKRCSQEKYEEGKKQKKGEDPTGLAFKDYEAGDFLKEILRNFEKVLPRRQETEKGGRYQRILHWQGEVMPETGIPEQETEKWLGYQKILYRQEKVMNTSIHSKQEGLVDFKDEILTGLYAAGLKETWLFFMPIKEKKD